MLSQVLLNEILRYDKERGNLYWRVKISNKITVGDIAGMEKTPLGYIPISIFGKSYLSHRVIFMMEYGLEPEAIDHIDHDTSNNVLSNLRAADASINSKNKTMSTANTSGFNGVTWDKRRKKWMASIRLDGKSKYLGRFDEKEDAIAMRKAADLKYNFHENHGTEKCK